MTLSLTVLGCSGTYAAPGGACSGYLFRSASTTVLVDCGPGALANLQQHIALTDLDAIVVTHEHPDHWLELPVMRNALKYSMNVDDLRLYSTAGTLGLAETLTDLAPTFRSEVIADGSELVVGDLQIRLSQTDHPVETLAVRVDSGSSSIGYTSDTANGWSAGELGSGLDVLVAEATFLDEQMSGSSVHLSAGQAGLQARAASARRLVLTHLLPGADASVAVAEAADAYGSPVEAAAVHRTYMV